jgi:hypothetical protein
MDYVLQNGGMGGNFENSKFFRKIIAREPRKTLKKWLDNS